MRSGWHAIAGRCLNQAQGLHPKTRIGVSTTVMKCRRCGLLYSNPLPIPENISDHYGVPPESYWTPEYFEVPPDHFIYQLQRMRTLAPHAKTFLDIGAGVGKSMRSAEREGLEAYGIEPSEPFYQRAIDGGGISPDRIVNVSVEDADLPRKFDLISFCAVLEHLYDPAASIAHAMKWLNPGGVIHVEVPDAGYLLSRIFNLYFWLGRTDFVVNISPMHAPFHLYEFTRKSFELNGERTGYSVACVERYASSMNIAPRLSKVLEPVMKATETGDVIIVYLKKL